MIYTGINTETLQLSEFEFLLYRIHFASGSLVFCTNDLETGCPVQRPEIRCPLSRKIDHGAVPGFGLQGLLRRVDLDVYLWSAVPFIGRNSTCIEVGKCARPTRDQRRWVSPDHAFAPHRGQTGVPLIDLPHRWFPAALNREKGKYT